MTTKRRCSCRFNWFLIYQNHFKTSFCLVLILGFMSFLVLLKNSSNIKNIAASRIGSISNGLKYDIDWQKSMLSNFQRLDYDECPLFSSFSSQNANKTTFETSINEEIVDFERIKQNLIDKSITLLDGGKYFNEVNKNCTANPSLKYKNIAFIIPYRNRLDSLKFFLNNMHEFLSKRGINYGIYLIEPVQNVTFNRGLLMNAGFLESIKDMLKWQDIVHDLNKNSRLVDTVPSYWDCFIFHDVDMIPEDERLFYTCDGNLPKHYATAVSKFSYSTQGYFSRYYGGVNAFTRDQYLSINGFANRYFGWGGEDDDLLTRVILVYNKTLKEDPTIGRFYMHEHAQDKANPDRNKILHKAKSHMKSNGVSNEGLSTVNYTVKSIQKTYLFTKIVLSYDKSWYSN